MRARRAPGTRWNGKGRVVWSSGGQVAAAVEVAWLATRPAGVTEPYGELVQHRGILGYDAC
jgi:hypothetical protein